MSVYKYQGDRENIDVTKMIALNSHCNTALYKSSVFQISVDRLQMAILIRK